MAIASTTAIDPFAALNAGTSTNATTANEAGSADRFLKLLVAQMKNQDPLNPMDNAEVTSQMAQINTVDGINKLNETVKGLNGQFVQLQAMQGASLVGRNVTVEGDSLTITNAEGEGAFELGATADHVKLEILTGAGLVLDTQDLGALSAGRHAFSWPAGEHTDAEGLRFRITPTTGAAAVPVTPLMLDHVESVSAGGDTLTLQLTRSGFVPYNEIKSVN